MRKGHAMSFEQENMFPSLARRVPDMVERMWKAADEYWADPKHTRLTQEELASILDKHPRTIQRYINKNSDLVPWPILRGMRRPWLKPPPPPPVPESMFMLDQRERDVLTLMTQGYTNLEIAHKLFMTTHTVKIRVEHILVKLGASDRVEAAVRAFEFGLVDVTHRERLSPEGDAVNWVYVDLDSGPGRVLAKAEDGGVQLAFAVDENGEVVPYINGQPGKLVADPNGVVHVRVL